VIIAVRCRSWRRRHWRSAEHRGLKTHRRAGLRRAGGGWDVAL